MSKVSEKQLRELRDPIQAALWRYTEMVDHRLCIDVISASNLELTPEKPNSARSQTTAKYGSQVLSDLVVIAFAPDDGTGSENPHHFADLQHDGYPDEPCIVPRSKATTHSEGHLTILSIPSDARNTEPILFAGSLDLLGIHDGAIKKVTALGQSSDDYETSMGGMLADPVVTTTVGYTGGRYNRLAYDVVPENRFGDPHAVYNSTPDLQICAFLNIPHGASVRLKVPLLNSLKAVIPAIAETIA